MADRVPGFAGCQPEVATNGAVEVHQSVEVEIARCLQRHRYPIGAFLLGRPLRISAAGIELLKHPHLLVADYYRQLFRQSWDIVWPFTIGSMVLSVVCSLIAYPVTSSLLRARQGSKAAN